MKPKLFIAVTGAGIKEVRLGGKSGATHSRHKGEGALARRWRKAAGEELAAYFAGRLRSFSPPCDLGNLPPFTRAVLRITARIPYGEVRSYRWVAERLGNPRSPRAVGNALARNPIPIIIPCHRVVCSDGTLGGYALGLNWKRRLLKLEKTHLRGF
ncbi:MAG: methylated-DNA--[protein]-cysteine S-methyltransferase [Candidatus Binatia bacterium]